MSTNQPGSGGPNKGSPNSFTQLDMVTTFAPPGQLGVRVGTVTGDINGAITINSTFDAAIPPPSFQSAGQALIVDTDGDQILLQVTFKGQFVQSPLLKAGGAFTAVYAVTSGTGKYTPLGGQLFNGVGVAVLPAENPSVGAAFSQFTVSPKGPKPK